MRVGRPPQDGASRLTIRTYRVGSDKIRRIRAVLDLALEHVPKLLA